MYRLIILSGVKDYGHLLAPASYRKAPIGVGHVFCSNPTDEDSHSATIGVLLNGLGPVGSHDIPQDTWGEP